MGVLRGGKTGTKRVPPQEGRQNHADETNAKTRSPKPICLLSTELSSLAQTWVQANAPNGYWYSVASSADGSRMAAAYNRIMPGQNLLFGGCHLSRCSMGFMILSRHDAVNPYLPNPREDSRSQRD